MKKTYLEKLGLKPVEELNKKICLERKKHLEKKIENGRLKGRLLAQAKYYRNWYGWLAKKGGSRKAS